MDIFDEVKFEKCKNCNGTGREECCGDHMCPGDKQCFDCNGEGIVLSDADKARKKTLETLLKYR